MIIKIVLIALLLFTVFNLFRALPRLLNPQSQLAMSKTLGWRVALSVLLLVGIILALVFGWITPNPRPY
ncbi:DUF2909 domain-containing protein [Photobacterium damselae]|uniref:DUF2909 domain-containing protein n=1 Tax=Photobacterium damselae TaxID=38293 RepID=UPI0010FCEDCC|nr:DUF2909 domain-containing protein [Photobacterium damselae]TLS79526.1 DUF2909 domain-containing protein [Photobacterium damselae subsp. damselae]TLS83041.1 DUF2909 domain-containing protein [Photobacterium damselae subsp. damselae]